MNLIPWRRRTHNSSVSVKESAVAQVHTGTGISKIFARWSGTDYAKIVEEGFQKNVIAYRAVQYLATAVGQVPLEVYLNDEPVEGFNGADAGHAVKRLLRRPNPRQSTNSFMERAMGFRLLHGNTYVEQVVGTDERTPQELYVQRPDRMEVLLRPDGRGIGAYMYNYPGRVLPPQVWPADVVTGFSRILHVKTFNPDDDLYGQSCFMAAMQPVDQHNAASTWNQALLQNMGIPSAAIKYKRNNMSQSKQDALRAELDELFSDPTDARRPVMFPDDIEWTQLSLSAVDMDWLNGKHTSARDICNGVGVPPMLIGIPGDNTYSNYKEARLAMYEERVIPETTLLLAELSHWLSTAYDAELELRADWDRVSALAPRREALWARINTAMHLSLNEKRRATGYEEKTGELYEEVLIPAGQLPASFGLPTGDDE